MSVTLRIPAVSLTLLAIAALASPANAQGDRRVSFNEGWRFHKGDVPGGESVATADQDWREVVLPHDWAIEGPFDKENNPNTGGLPVSGTGWYRKHFRVPAADKRMLFSVEFDGAMANARVWLNGAEIGFRPYGYASFTVDLTPHLQWDADNVLAVRLTPEAEASRWYPGAGIYRNVWLTKTGAVHVSHWGIGIRTPEITPSQATVAVSIVIENRSAKAAALTVESRVEDAAGKAVARSASELQVDADKPGTLEQTIAVAQPRLWDIDQPYLYRLVTDVKQGGKTVDSVTTPFGIRTVEFSATKGFVLNGRQRKLHGVCDHHDLGALGAAINTRALERQLEILRGMGVNAIRTSHNPPAPELLDLCDRMGFVVIDEAFDMWRIPKVKNGLSKFFDEWHEQDLTDLIRRDRNHPSVMMWSIGNEIPEQGRAGGGILAKQLTEICHREDPTRPTTSAFDQPDGAIKNELAANVDVPGFNYKPTRYEEFQKAHPAWVMYGSETESCVSSRGVYHLPLKLEGRTPDLQVSGWDIQAPPWAYCPDVEFFYQNKLPNLLGEFVWTGFDYLGEPTPYGGRKDWPSRSSYFGIVDLAGFPKDRYYLYKSVWTETPTVHLLPHWNWEGHEGETIPVMVYTNAEEVELFLNGKSLGKKRLGVDTVEIPVGKNVSSTGHFTSPFRLAWDVPYAAGELKAVGYRNGAVYAQDTMSTAGKAARIVVTPDRASLHANGQDLAFFTVRVEDGHGNLCPLAGNLVKFKLSGPGTIAGVDNGNAASVEPFQAGYRTAFNGLALLIVRTRKVGGTIQVTASSEGLESGEARVESRQ